MTLRSGHICNLRAKNGLTPADAQCVEETFQAALAALSSRWRRLRSR